ncbi:MAG: ATP-binding cassette domain-containing protein, partial [Clostridiales bacterium]|nr:ATP-binding cassette domain-containing protein [Clostridiales bacterium]
IIMGVFPADGGEIWLDGRPIDRGAVKIGYLPEERGLYQKKPILDQLIYFACLKGMKSKEAGASAKFWLERLEMGAYAGKKLDTLSKGNQQKIQFAATLITDPDIVILDEPFSGLDPVNAGILKDIVRELAKAGKIVLFSSHQMGYIEEFCENIAIMTSGSIAVSGSLKEIKRGYDRSKMVVTSREPQKIKAYINDNLRDVAKNCQVKGEELLVTLHEAGMKNRLLQSLSQGNFDIDEFRVYEPTLNDIFVQYTEGGI